MPRLLLLLPQLPQDPASGAARSLRTIAEWLAAAGWSVRGLATTATEAASTVVTAELLQALGLKVQRRQPNRALYRHDREVLEFRDQAGVAYQLLETGRHGMVDWQGDHGDQFNRLFQRELADHRPDVVLAYGGHQTDIERYQSAQAAGCRVVFGLRNHGYKSARWLASLDAVLTCSDFLSGVYRAELGLESTALPSPISLSETVAPDREPIFFTAINPSVQKGVYFLARLAEELSQRRPDIPMLFVESRGSGGMLVRAGLDGGFDLRRHENLMLAPAVPRPLEIYRGTRVLLAPSVWEEPFGRVAVEALVNGIPAIVSDRGGLPEAVGKGGFVLPLPASLTVETRVPVSADDVEAWLRLILRLADDPAFYAEASARALVAAETHAPANLAMRYKSFFEGVLKG